MKKIPFVLYVFAIIIMFPLYMSFELGYVAQEASETNTPVSVIEKVEEPLKAFAKVKSQKNNQGFVNSSPLTLISLNYNLK